MSRRLLILVAVSLAIPVCASGQGTRDSLVRAGRDAYEAFETGRALDLLTAALDPARGRPDSTWSYALQLLSQIHLEENRPGTAAVWLRWGLRQFPALRPDTLTFTSRLVAAVRAQRDSAAAQAGDQAASTAWTWPGRGSAETGGRIRIQSIDPSVPLTVLVVGRGVVRPSDVLALPAATYEVQVNAPGYIGARVAREVLPGATTVISFNLRSLAVAAQDSVMPSATGTAALARAGKVTPELFGVTQPPCGSGFSAGRGLVVTSYRTIRGASRISVEWSGGSRSSDGIRVAAYDAATDLAVLQVPNAPADSIVPSAQQPADTQYVWSAGFPACAAGTLARFRTGSRPGASQGLALDGDIASGQRGSALIGRDGSLAGAALSGRTAASLGRVQALLADARGAVTRNATLSLADVGAREKHAYGTLVLTSRTAGASVRVRPLESWQWPELAREGPAPLTLAGPVGRYQVDVLVGGQSRGQTTAEIRSGIATTVALDPLIAQAAVPSQQIGVKRGKSPLPFIVLGGVGAGAAVAVLVLKGSGSGPIVTTTEYGSINVDVPANPSN